MHWSSRSIRTTAVILLCPLLASAQDAPPRQAQDSTTPRERELQALIQQLNERISELEAKVESQQRQPDMAALVAQLMARIEALENKPQSPPPPKPPVEPAPNQLLDTPTSTSPDLEARVSALEDIEALRPANALDVFWKNGIRLESADGAYKFKLGGRVHFDTAFFDSENGIEDDIGGNLASGVEFRRARLYLSGLIHDSVSFKFQYDWADGDADFKDMYVSLLDIPILGDLVVGQFKEPFGLEVQASSNHMTFMERSTVSNALLKERSTGIGFYNRALDGRMAWGLGAYVDSDSYGNADFNDGQHYVARVTGLPWYEDDGRKLLHLGLAYAHRAHDEGGVRVRTRPESSIAEYFLDTGRFEAESCNLLGVEGALVYGPFSLQGEYIQAWFDGVRGSDPQYNGFYVQTSYALTGEHRRYSKKRGVFVGIKPDNDFNIDGSAWGAWEVAARYSNLDLNDGAVDGDRLDDFTFALNWYLNTNTRVMFNYVLADREESGHANIFQWRVMLHF